MSGRRVAAEAVGTFFLVFIGPGAVMVNAYSGGAVGHVGVSLAFAFVVIAMIYALGHLSGAHINPAVTIAFWSARRFPGALVIPYLLAQCAGAVAASLALRATLGAVGNLGATLPAVAVPAAFCIEWLLSFALMFVIMAVATDKRVADGSAAIAVGLTVGFCALVGGPLTGASMNPARTFGPALVGGLWRAHWLYWVSPITAMVVAAWAYDLLRQAAPPKVVREAALVGVQGPIADRVESMQGEVAESHWSDLNRRPLGTRPDTADHKAVLGINRRQRVPTWTASGGDFSALSRAHRGRRGHPRESSPGGRPESPRRGGGWRTAEPCATSTCSPRRFGFESIDRVEVPAALLQSVEFREACPAPAVVMRRSRSR